MRIVLAGLAFIGFGVGSALLSWIVLPVASCDWNRVRRQRRCQRLVRHAFVFFHDYMNLCGLVDYNPRAAAPELPSGPSVLVTNHPTLVDVVALIAVYGELCVVVKASLFRNPLLGPLLRLCGHIDGGKGGFGEPPTVVEQAIDRLRHGHRVLIFPEGSRSPESGLRRFHLGAFRAAFEAQVPLFPIAIFAEPPGLRSGQPWYEIPATAIRLTLQPLRPLVVGTCANPRELLRDTRQQIETALGLGEPTQDSRPT